MLIQVNITSMEPTANHNIQQVIEICSDFEKRKLIRSALRMLKYWYLSERNVLRTTLPQTSVKMAGRLLLSTVTKNSEFHLIFGVSLLNTFADMNGFSMTLLIITYIVCISSCLLLTSVILDLCKLLTVRRIHWGLGHKPKATHTLNYWLSGAGTSGKALATTRQIRLRTCFTDVALYCHGCHWIELSWFAMLCRNIWCSCWLSILTSFISYILLNFYTGSCID